MQPLSWLGQVWVNDHEGPPRELSLPAGSMHLVLRVSGPPVHIYEGLADATGRVLGHALVGGARDRAYVRQVGGRVRSVGAVLGPGAAQALFGVPAGELAQRHTPLADLWGRAAATLLADLRDATSAAEQRARLLAALRQRASERRPHPVVTHALGRFAAGAAVAAVVRESGYSQRRFLSLFRDEVGLSPKRHCKVQRLQAALALLARPGLTLAAVAARAGYSDQAHLCRDFQEHCGLTPLAYRKLMPASPGHVPLP